jgi:hypothetical protein
MGLFDWKLVKEEKHEDAPSVLYFERNENVPYYQEMVAAEKDTEPKLLPFWSLIAVVALAFTIMTVYLILWLSMRETFSSIKYFYFFFIPAMILLLVDTLLFYLRSRQLMKYLQNEDAVVKKAEERMKAIKEKYGK